MAKGLDRLPNVHPGEVLREDFMKPLGLSASAVAQALGVTRPVVSRVTRGLQDVSPEMALLLSRYFGTTPRFWMNLQALYDLEEAREKLGRRLDEVQPRETAAA